MNEARIRELEARIDRLERQLANPIGRPALAAHDLQLRLAKIQSTANTTAVTSETGLRVWTIRFVDATFDNTEGPDDPALTTRATTNYFAAAPADFYAQQNQLVIVCRINNRWWIVRPLNPWNLLLCRSDDDYSKGDTGTFSIYEGTAGSETDTGRDVSAKVRYADIGDYAWCLLAPVANGYEVIEFECEPETRPE